MVFQPGFASGSQQLVEKLFDLRLIKATALSSSCTGRK